MIDPVDQWAVAGIGEVEGKTLRSAMDEKLDLAPKTDEDKAQAEEEAAAQGDLSSLLARFKHVLEGQVSEVRLSTRLTDSPACLVVPDGGLGPYIERLLRASQGTDLPVQKRILELNAKHPLIQAMRALHERDAESAEVSGYIELLYDQSLLSEGSPVEDPARIAKHLTRLMQLAAQQASAAA
jgi:molecular chaperone HtpG